MIVALNNYNERVHADAAHKEDVYRCPICHDEVITKQGYIKIWHFAHKTNRVCVTEEPETPQHEEMKYRIWASFKSKPYVTTCEMEYPIGSRRPDVFLKTEYGNIAIECQRATLSIEQLDTKLYDYSINGIYCLYIVHQDVVGTNKQRRIPAWVQMLRQIYFGRVYTFTGDKVAPVRFTPATRYKDLAYNRDGDQVGGYEYYLKSTFDVCYGPPVRAPMLICTNVISGYKPLPGMYLIARFPDKAFWK